MERKVSDNKTTSTQLDLQELALFKTKDWYLLVTRS